jgi:hypothetical protein
LNNNPPVSVTRIPQLVEREDGLFDFVGAESIQECIAIYNKIDGTADSARWGMAAVAADAVANASYGEKRVEEFAQGVGKGKQYVYRLAKAHTFWTHSPHGYYSNLTFSHHVKAIVHPEPLVAMEHAIANGLPAVILEQWISEQAQEKSSKPKKKNPKRQNEFREFLERVDGLILNDFMKTCPNVQWGRRVFGQWREDVTWELSQLQRTEVSDRIVDAVNDGAQTIPDIKIKTGLTIKVIEGVVGQKVADGEWEFVREGGKKDDQRGTMRTIIHVVGDVVCV